MLFPLPPVINVLGVKVNGPDSAANVSVGPTGFWGGLDSLNKNTQFSEVNGDFGASPVWYGIVVDNDLWDTPMWQTGW